MGVIGTGSAQQWTLYIADTKGLFAKAGIAVEVVTTPSAAAVMQQVVAGSLDLGTAGASAPLRAIDQGIGVAILGIETQEAPYSIWGKSTFNSLADLRSRTISVGGATDVTRTYLELMVVPAGVPKDAYDLVFAGSAAARFSALASGAVDAAMLNPPTTFRAKAAGFKNLGSLSDYAHLPFTTYVVESKWAKSHKEALGKFLSAIASATEWFYADANRGEAIEIQRKASGADPQEVADTYDLYRTLRVFPTNVAIKGSKIGDMVAIMKGKGELTGPTDLNHFIDPEIAQIAEAAALAQR